jgi:hypothetical protein
MMQDLGEIPKGANTQWDEDGSIKLNMTPKVISKGGEQGLWLKASLKETGLIKMKSLHPSLLRTHSK